MRWRGRQKGAGGKGAGSRSSAVLLHGAVWLPRRQLCRTNCVLFMCTPSHKKCYSSRLFRLILNYSSSPEMYPDWSCFELWASFFTAGLFFSPAVWNAAPPPPPPPHPTSLIYTSFYYLSCKNPCVLNAALIMGWQTVSGAQNSGKWEFLVLLCSSFP